MGVTVHPRVHEQHPELSDEDVLDAWENCFRAVPRLKNAAYEYIAIGSDSQGRLIELIAICLSNGEWLIYHAFTPPTKKAIAELGMGKRRK